MFWFKNLGVSKEKRENETKLRNLHGREVKYASKRDDITYGETVIGKNGVISVIDDSFQLICNEKIIFSSAIKELWGSDLMSLDGIILTHFDKGIDDENKIVVYYKYYRKVD